MLRVQKLNSPFCSLEVVVKSQGLYYPVDYNKFLSSQFTKKKEHCLVFPSIYHNTIPHSLTSTKLAGKRPVCPLKVPDHQPSSILSMFVMTSPGSNEISSSPAAKEFFHIRKQLQVVRTVILLKVIHKYCK